MELLEVDWPSAKPGLNRALKTGDARLRRLDETWNFLTVDENDIALGIDDA